MAGFRLLKADAVRAHIRGVLHTLGVGQNALARRMGVTNGHLSRVLSGEKEPGDKVLGWLGYERVVRYQRRARR